jgi:hypothetical protein
LKPDEIRAEKLGAITADLEAGLDAVSVSEDQKHAAGQRLFATGGGVGAA